MSKVVQHDHAMFRANVLRCDTGVYSGGKNAI